MTLSREEWLPALASMLDVVAPTTDELDRFLDLATALLAETDSLTAAISFWIIGTCNYDIEKATSVVKFIASWDDSGDF